MLMVIIIYDYIKLFDDYYLWLVNAKTLTEIINVSAYKIIRMYRISIRIDNILIERLIDLIIRIWSVLSS